MSVAPRRADYLARFDALLVVRDATAPDEAPEIFVMVEADGSVTGFNGHVDLGTGIRTALAQIVAEELDVSLARVTMVLGDPDRAPDQGATIASETIQVAAVPLRHAAAQARQWLVRQAALLLNQHADALVVEDGVARGPDGRQVPYGDVLLGRQVHLPLDITSPIKPVAQHRIVGRSVPRADIPAKATGQAVFVHDMRVPGMLHGRVVRPPYAGVDAGPFVGTSLIAVDRASVAHIPGLIDVVVIGDFIGVVAEREEHAAEAARCLAVRWKPVPALPDLADIPAALRANPGTPRRLLDHGDIEAALAGAAVRMPRQYVWPYQMHGAIGPSCALADHGGQSLRLWSGTQNPHVLRADLARLLDLPEARIDIVRMEAAGCYGRNCADDVCADAALLSRAVRRPVRVQLTREQEHAWEPKGAAQLMEVDGGLTEAGAPAGYAFSVRYPSNAAPLLAALLTGAMSPEPAVLQMGDRTAIPPYDYDHIRVVAHDMKPIVRAAWLRGVSALPNTFAHESYIDELAAAAEVDPVEYRLRYLNDGRAADLVRRVAARAGWEPRTAPGREGGDGDIRRGRGFAYALYVHSHFPGFGAAWSAWVADVAVDTATGEVAVSRVTVGQDCGLAINPEGVRQQIHGNVIQSVSRVLQEAVTFDATSVTSREWGAYPIITFPDVPAIDVLMVPRPEQPPLGVGESTSVPSAAAIANAIYDATGVRFRELPFTPERIRAGLLKAGIARPLAVAAPPPPPVPRKRRWLREAAGLAGAMLAGAVSVCAAALSWPAAIDPIARPDPAVYAASTLDRGRQLAAIGNCAFCHTVPGGAAYAGGRAVRTPFGALVAGNITPDVATGIGAWSYPAFERAMRHGVSRDGSHLYPAFPYTSFTRATDADLQALYAYLMAQPAVAHAVAPSRLPAPFARPLMAAWNGAFHRPGPRAPETSRSAQWNRGAYLVDGLGHCGACHSPRNALGAERSGSAYLSGGRAAGWDAPPLNALSHAPVPWTEAALFAYLRTGHTPEHGVAAGPMAPVVAGLATVAEADVRAIAAYLATLAPPPAPDPQAVAAKLEREAVAAGRAASFGGFAAGARLFQGACAVCHAPGGPTLLGAKVSLAVNSNLHAPAPENLIRVILHGIDGADLPALGAMPGFADSLDDRQVADLVAYLRRSFAPGQPEWTDLAARCARVRADQP